MSTPETSGPINDDNRSGIERRVFVRHSCDLDTSCQPVSSARGMEWNGKIQDISCGGLALVLSRRFELGTLLTIELQGKNGGPNSRTMLARVVRVTSLSPGSWLMGCKFATALLDDELKALL
jgi:hypothetical protein